MRLTESGKFFHPKKNREHMHPKKIIAILCLISLLSACSFGGIWSSPPIRAQVVGENGLPIKGAVVVGTWEAKKEFHHASLGYFEVQEVTTDESGWFTLPSFPPRYVRDTILTTEPQLLIIHPDYQPELLVNSFPGDPGQAPSVMKFYMQDRQIKLAPLRLHSYELRSAVLSVTLRLGFSYLGKSQTNSNFCVWERMPKFLVELEKLRVKLSNAGQNEEAGFITPLETAISWGRTNCGDATKILKEVNLSQTSSPQDK
ncbi:carboxypeptidase-like regulatory domain-containing protein [Undibacterium cyanobacteriorum]|uniref:Carboxypeptidase-like regulatory domain-containing protein n=1 Tax=Undibacterium cyanobacteriorum TaxID=3073561 RepID=A0ABY9RLE2_9BURK|nr:carboxypeptidase-like regulatory domain-containing protein [Undibacterium sp. 20NA77.5]WMW82041.1 carboxypeptidase-like regulatory domain-containing protein [Undibacterium sp. 20NA77.5]